MASVHIFNVKLCRLEAYAALDRRLCLGHGSNRVLKRRVMKAGAVHSLHTLSMLYWIHTRGNITGGGKNKKGVQQLVE